MDRGSMGVKSAKDGLIVGLYLTVRELDATPSSVCSTAAFLDRLQYQLRNVKADVAPSLPPNIQRQIDSQYDSFRTAVQGTAL